MPEEQKSSVRTESVKAVLTSNIPLTTIMACRNLTDSELEFVRVYTEMNAPAPRKPRKDIGVARTKALSAS